MISYIEISKIQNSWLLKRLNGLYIQLLSVFFSILSFNDCNAQLSPNSYSITFLSGQDGLSQATNRYMLQDSKGYMWLSSQDGINRYNGNEFFHFSDSFFYENCKPLKQIFGILEDVNGDIWMGSRQGLYKYQQRRNAFKKYNVSLDKQAPGNIIMPFATVGNEVWFSEDALTFKAINCNTQKIRLLYKVQDSLKLIESFKVIPQVDKRGNIWMVNAGKLFKIDLRSNTVIKYPVQLTGIPASPDILFRALSLDSSTNVLAIATGDGLALFDTEQCRQIEVPDKLHLISGQEAWYVKAGNGFFWVSNDKCHLIKVSADGKEVLQMFDKKVLDNHIHRGSGTACIYIDQWKRIWLNADGEYTAIIDIAPIFIKKVSKDIVNGLPSGTTLSIAAAGEDVWVSDTYLSVIDRSSAAIKKSFSVYELTGKPGFFRQVFYDDLLNRVWFTTGSTLYYYSLLTGRVSKTIFQVTGSSNIDYVRNFLRLNHDELLIARMDGVYKINNEGSRGDCIREFGNADINHLGLLSGNRLALSVIGKPLKIFSCSPGFKPELKQSINIENTIMMVSEDTLNGLIWAATEHGVYKIDNTSYKILRHYTAKDGMANDFIYAVIPDKYGWVWCSTNKGIIAINQANEEIRNFGMSENLQDLEFNNRAFATDKDGYIYFGGVKGLNYFKPPLTDNDTVKARLVIEEVNLDDTVYVKGINPDLISNIQYRYGAGSLSIKLQALQLKKAASLKVRYRLKGEHKEWMEAANNEYIRMFNLAPGKYQLEISYAEGNKKNGSVHRLISINVLPPWYRTRWFLLLATLTAFVLLRYIVLYRQQQRIKKLQQENEIIKLKVEQQLAVNRERERIITDLHDDVGATLSSMHIYGDLANSVWNTKPEESRKMVEKISVTSKELMSRMGDIIWSMKPADEEKFTLEARLKNYCNELLSPKNILCEFHIDEKLAASITHPEARKNILLVAKEAINNTAKYSEASKAVLKFQQQGENILLSISDNGKGYDPMLAKYGNGLLNMKQRCAQLNGSCSVTAATGHGVVVLCNFPIATISHNA